MCASDFLSVMYGGYFNYLRQFNAFARENPTVPVLTISFEEMKRVCNDTLNLKTRLNHSGLT